MSRRFRWTRERYYRAHHLSRLLLRLNGYSYEPPSLVQRLMDLYALHPSNGDPLTVPIGWRYDRCDIPF
ncbi:MAG: hypothetical protein KF871_10715 [Hydrogenophaga sp.]|uniref:hypothetical protein n=1 Tax=Hydrogenophaga sp. TaxID=1904254 RepID=UPI001D73C2DA|nr:hypothetical protein [Hydrogenophaga sp.]MBX3610354.1 hypothetical protein [Hydrogenophaga sp.]